MSKRKLSCQEPAETVPEETSALPQPLPDRNAKFAKLYATEPNFRELAGFNPRFAPYIRHGSIDFSDPNAVMELTKTLLSRDFGLNLEMPQDRLCPMVHNRHNYILWLKGLVDSTLPAGASQSDVIGLDIGTGASCIYPLLGCVQRPWSFIGTDIDPSNIKNALENVARNNLAGRIRILARTPTDPLVPLNDSDTPRLTFTMTNPPFYESCDDLERSAAQKARPPFTACTGSAVEMVTAGGETGFAARILAESLEHRTRVQWYTIMFGKQSSVETLVKQLRAHEIGNYAVTEFVQGARTRRWAVAWSFGPRRAAQDVARGVKAAMWKGILPPLVEVEVVAFPAGGEVAELGLLAETLRETLQALELISFSWDTAGLCVTGKSGENVWSRAYRRRKQREEVVASKSEENSTVFGFKAWISAGMDKTRVICRWTEGYNEKIFTSFQGYLKTAISKGQAGNKAGTA